MTYSEAATQENYYRRTAAQYDDLHMSSKDEHFFALAFMTGMLDYLGVKSVLDIGSGTGRVIEYIRKHRPDIRVTGIEPVAELRAVAYSKGLSEKDVTDGNALDLKFEDKSFDLACEFGVLHHIKAPNMAISEMIRVASKAVFISDNNIYGSGSCLLRSVKQLLDFFGLYKAAYFFKTRGRMYDETEADGIAYHYSVFDSYDIISEACSSVHLANTNVWTPFSRSIYRTASHVGLLGILKDARQHA